jgi:hypothetical protein
MYTLTRLLSRKALIRQQIPTAGGSLLIAELFFKFGSFTLEAMGFLATWFVLDAIYTAIDGRGEGSESTA